MKNRILFGFEAGELAVATIDIPVQLALDVFAFIKNHESSDRRFEKCDPMENRNPHFQPRDPSLSERFAEVFCSEVQGLDRQVCRQSERIKDLELSVEHSEKDNKKISIEAAEARSTVRDLRLEIAKLKEAPGVKKSE